MNKKALFNFLIFIFSLQISYSQNVGISATGLTPNTSAMLDIVSTSSGILIPRMTNAQKNAITVGATQDGLLIYQTDAGTQGIGFYYYSNSAAAWLPFLSGWALKGNAGLTSPAVPATYGTSTIGAAENWMGTTDAKDVVFGTNNIERMRIKLTTGYVGIGSAAPSSLLTVGTAATTYAASFLQTVNGTANGYLGTLIQNNSSGTGAWGEVAVAADNTQLSLLAYSTGNTLNGSLQQNRAAVIAEANTAGLDFVCNKTSAGNGDMRFYTNGYSSVAAERMRILQSGYIGIGTTTPADALVVKVPAASGINAITADVTGGNGTGNALQALSKGDVSYSTIFATNVPLANAGSGFDITSSHHTIAATMTLTTSSPYAFAVMGEITSGHSNPCAGVVGVYATVPVWGALGYRNSNGTANYGGYFDASTSTGTGIRMSNTGSDNNTSIGIGAYGDLFGGWIRGNAYGLAVKGEKISLYVNGKTVVNQPIIQLTKTADNNTIVNYTPVSATADLQLHGVVQMEKGIATVIVDASTLNQFASTEDLTIIATPSGQTNGVYAQLTDNKLIIKENNNGTANVKISWVIIGKRNIDENFVPEELQDKNFDNNLIDLMRNEKDIPNPGKKTYSDEKKSNSGATPK